MTVTDLEAAPQDTIATLPGLLSPITIRGLTLKSRIVLSPMCQFSSTDGYADEWHLVHLASRTIGGAALTFTEAAAVTEQGRITPGDLGIWHDGHTESVRRLADAITRFGGVPGIQLAHAGRKASRSVPWLGNQPLTGPDGGWPTVGPSAVAFEDGGPAPHELDAREMAALIDAFEAATARALAAGFKVIEVHAAHGYLLHQFLSPVSNHRSDDYGGSIENRARLLLQIAARLRSVIPSDMPLFVRISATDWIEGEPSWDLPQSVTLARLLHDAGVDVVDASSGAVSLKQKITIGPGYQVPFARQIRAETGIKTAAVGLITDAEEADAIIKRGDADLVFVGRAFLRNPYWGLAAHEQLGVEVSWPNPYGPHALRRGMKK